MVVMDVVSLGSGSGSGSGLGLCLWKSMDEVHALRDEFFLHEGCALEPTSRVGHEVSIEPTVQVVVRHQGEAAKKINK